MIKKITIIWATDGFGFWLAKFILKNFWDNVEMIITWRNKEKWEKNAKKIWAKFSDNNLESVKNADITVFAVPIAFMTEIIKKVAPFVKENSIVLDVCSIKKWPSKALRKYSPKSVFVLPTHPMFGPFISTIAWQIFVLTPLNSEDKNDERYIFLKNFLENKGAKVVEETPEEHDKMMAVVQGLTHFNMFVLADTMKNLDFDIEKSFSFVSPIYKIMISSVGRYIGQNPKLYGDIQMYNLEVPNVYKEFIKSTNNFNNFVKEKDEESFIKNIENSAKYFWKNSLKWQKYTDKIIFMLSKQVEFLEKNIWKKIEAENIYSREKKSWILEKFEDRKIFLEDWKNLELDEWEII